MFGYIRVYKPDMKISEYETYKAIYCGLCRELGREYGPAARMTLSFDFTFLAALMMALAEDKPVYTRRKCAANPLKSCIMADLGEIQSRCCDCAVLMLWYKLEDDLKTLQTKYDTDTANIRRDAAIDLALTRAHARDPQLTRAALSMDDIKIGTDGKITGLDAQVESLKKDKAWLFEEDGAGQSGKQGDKGGNPNGGQGGGYNPQSGGNPNTVNDLGSALAEVYNTNG